jgi:hypothetical protein
MVGPTFKLNRDDLAKFIKDPRTIRAFESLDLNTDELVVSVNNILSSPLVGVSLSDGFTSDRALSGSSDILLTDGGAKGNLTISLTPTGVAPGTYGSPAHTIAFAVDSKGRITLAAQYALNTDNITEGATNLFFTTARARLAISDGTGISYNDVTGVVAVDNNYIAYGTYTPTVTPIANVSASTAYICMYTRIGDTVHVSGKVDVQPTAGATITSLELTLPIASDIGVVTDLSGNAATIGVTQCGGMDGNVANNTASLRYLAGDTTNRGLFFNFTYRII